MLGKVNSGGKSESGFDFTISTIWLKATTTTISTPCFAAVCGSMYAGGYCSAQNCAIYILKPGTSTGSFKWNYSSGVYASLELSADGKTFTHSVSLPSFHQAIVSYLVRVVS